MRRKVIIYILICFTFGCTGKSQEIKERSFFYSNGKLRKSYKYSLHEKDTLIIGLERLFHENGVLKLEVSYDQMGRRKSVIGYHPNGEPRLSANFKNSFLEGERITYYESGIIRSKTFYKKDKCYLHQFYYDTKGDLKTYIFCDPEDGEGSLIYQYENKKIIDIEGQEKPILIANVDIVGQDKQLLIGSSLKCNIFPIVPPFFDVEVWVKLDGVMEDWEKLENQDSYAPYLFHRKMKSEGDYLFRVRQVFRNSTREVWKEEINTLNFTVTK